MNGTKIRYIDLAEGELMHWKYIKKTKLPNGKWRYYYDAKYIKKVRKNGKRSYYYDFDAVKNDLGVNKLQAYSKARSELNAANKAYSKAGSKAANTAKYLSQTKNPTKWSNRPVTLHNQAMSDLSKNLKNLNEAKTKTQKAYDEYIGTPLSYITHPSEAIKKRIASGKNSVDRALG